MGTKNNPGIFDCEAAAEPDEPRFTLLARDVQAPARVRDWATVYGERKGHNPAKLAEALDCADAMDAWREKHRPEKVKTEDDA